MLTRNKKKGSYLTHLVDVNLLYPTRWPLLQPSLQVGVALTPEGLTKRFKVISAVFSYLDLIRRSGLPSFLPSEIQTLSDLDWRFQDKERPISLVSQLAANMQGYDTEKAIR